MVKVLFVCLGNICRSPTAEGIFRDLVERHGLGREIATDSAGTGDWHVGQPPDSHAQAEALKRSIDISRLRARQVCVDDFRDFDHMIAMDRRNYAALDALRPAGARVQLKLLLEFAPALGRLDVPDPYYGGAGGFARVIDMIELAARGLFTAVRTDSGRVDSGAH